MKSSAASDDGPVTMAPPPALTPGRAGAFLAACVRFLSPPPNRRAVAGVVALAAAAVAGYFAWTGQDNPERRDGNHGHILIDFGGQWLMGRLLVTGNGGRLYDRNVQRELLREAYPRADEPPGRPQSDAEQLLSWLMGSDDPGAARTVAACATPLAARDPFGAAALRLAGAEVWTGERLRAAVAPRRGGPLYPPINAFVYAPLGLLRPQPAYRLLQALNLLLTFACALLVERLTRGGVWWQVAAPLLMLFPGFAGAMGLAQNPLLTLSLLLLGWLLIARGREAAGGAVWGLLAFKPVWALAFFAVPLLTRRWRAAAAMALAGGLAAAATLPVVGWGAWTDWLAIGRDAAELYTRCENWIMLSRDVFGLPRRWLLTFADGLAEKDEPLEAVATACGWALWGVVVEVTVLVALLRPGRVRAAEGPGAAFVLLGAWQACYHFMYYDVMLAALPVCLLFTRPRRYLRPVFLRRGEPPLPAAWTAYYDLAPGGRIPASAAAAQALRSGWVRNRVPPTVLALAIGLPSLAAAVNLWLWGGAAYLPPLETFCLLLLWAWCGWRCWRGGPAGRAA